MSAAVEGRKVVVTGTIPGHSRLTAQTALREAGAFVQGSVSSSTEVLVTGERVGQAKVRKAMELGLEILAWEEVWQPPENERREISVPLVQGSELGSYLDGQHGPDDRPWAKPLPSQRQIAPMLAKADELPTGAAWLFEVKWDGHRCIATVTEEGVSMMSRSGKTEMVGTFPAVAAELATCPDGVYDGELIAGGGFGNGNPGERYVVFDMLELGGRDMRGDPLDDRRRVLEAALTGTELIAVSPAFHDGAQLIGSLVGNEVEGIVAKKRSSTYKEGSRAGDWIKVKFRCEQEFVVVGWTPGKGALEGGPGALLVAYYDDAGELVYAGKVGTGAPDDLAKVAQLEVIDPLPREFVNGAMSRPEFDSITWVEAEMVVQVAFQKWTTDGRLWHPSLLRIRTDKDPHDVRRES